MPRSKFATKAYGPTKPKICENQQLPPGLLPSGPGTHNTIHFLLGVVDTGAVAQLISGSAVLSRSTDPTVYHGIANAGDYSIAFTLTALPAIFAPIVQWSITRKGIFVWSGLVSRNEPRSVNPYDTGIMKYGTVGPWGQQMVRVVARD
jgi:hypothetical protein